MKKSILFIISMLGTLCLVQANEPVEVEAEYLYCNNESHLSEKAVVEKAYRLAREKAIELRFGVSVGRLTNLITTETTQGDSVQTSEKFIDISQEHLNARWLITHEEKIIEPFTYTDGVWRGRVYVRGVAEPIIQSQIALQAKLLTSAQGQRTPDVFYDNDPMFLRFSSPVSGTLCVYLVDETHEVYCLLPYDNNQQGSQVIEANKEYLFFDSDTDRMATEYQFTTRKTEEINVIYLVFSPDKLTKPADQKGGKDWRGDALPRSLAYSTFLDWQTQNMRQDPQLQIIPIQVVIRK